MQEYWILVTRNVRGNVVSLYSPNLKKELIEPTEFSAAAEQPVIPNFNYRSFAREKLNSELQIRHRILFPRGFQELEKKPITPLQHWECFKIDVKKRNRIFEVGLPVSGHICNVLAILTYIFITYMALKIATQNSEDQDSSTSTGLAISGAIFSSLINFFLYILSGASETLIEAGSRLDNLCREQDFDLIQDEIIDANEGCNCQFYNLSTLAAGSILGNSFVSAVRQYLEFTLLTDKFLSLDPDLSTSDHERYYEIITYLVTIPNLISSTFTATAFQTAFARRLIAHLTDRKTRIEGEHTERDALIQRLSSSTNSLIEHKERSDDERLQLTQSRPLTLQFSGGADVQKRDGSDTLGPNSESVVSKSTWKLGSRAADTSKD